MSPAPSIHLLGANSRGAVLWWKIVAGERRYSSIPSKTAEAFAVGRSWESKGLGIWQLQLGSDQAKKPSIPLINLFKTRCILTLEGPFW